METLTFDVLRFVYLLALCVIVGGGLALGAVSAPTLFRELDRSRAGTLFGAILARWDGIATIAAIALVASALLRLLTFESIESLALRYVAVAVVLVATLYGSLWAGPIARGLRRETPGFDDLPPDAPVRREFARYHARSTRAITAAILAGLVALYLS